MISYFNFIIFYVFVHSVVGERNFTRINHYRQQNFSLLMRQVNQAFGGRLARIQLGYQLQKLCENTTDPCEGHGSVEFLNFLSALKNLLGDDVYNVTTKESWDEHCAIQKSLRDSRIASVCQATAFTFVPFSVSQRQSILSRAATPTDPKNSKLHVISVDSRHRANSPIDIPMLRSACVNNLPVTLLGSKGNRHRFELGDKIKVLREYLDGLPTESNTSTIVMFVDASDVQFQTSATEILKRFHEANTRILFSAEHSCFPFKYFPWGINLGRWAGGCRGTCHNSRYVCDELFPLPPEDAPDKKNMWLNSGVFIGYLSDVRAMLDFTRHLPPHLVTHWPGADQGLYSHMFLSGMLPITLDYHSRVFQAWGLVDKPDSKTDVTTDTLVKEGDVQGRRVWVNSFTNLAPAVLHFNADGKRIMHKIQELTTSIQYTNSKVPRLVPDDKKCAQFFKFVPLI